MKTAVRFGLFLGCLEVARVAPLYWPIGLLVGVLVIVGMETR